MTELELYPIPTESALAQVTDRHGIIREIQVINFDPQAVTEFHSFSPEIQNMAFLQVQAINRALAAAADPLAVHMILTLIAAHFELQFSYHLPRKMK